MSLNRLAGWLRLTLFVLSTAAVMLVSGWHLLGVAGLLLGIAVLFDPPTRRLLAKLRFWLLIVSPLLAAVIFLGKMKPPVFTVSPEDLKLGLEMSLRALALILSVQLLVSGLTVSRIMRRFETYGFKGLGFALGIAQNMLSTLTETVEAIFITIRLRGGFRRRPLYAVGLFLISLISSTLLQADQVVNAASARAFDPSSRGRNPPTAAREPGRRVGRRLPLHR